MLYVHILSGNNHTKSRVNEPFLIHITTKKIKKHLTIISYPDNSPPGQFPTIQVLVVVPDGIVVPVGSGWAYLYLVVSLWGVVLEPLFVYKAYKHILHTVTMGLYAVEVWCHFCRGHRRFLSNHPGNGTFVPANLFAALSRFKAVLIAAAPGRDACVIQGLPRPQPPGQGQAVLKIAIAWELCLHWY